MPNLQHFGATASPTDCHRGSCIEGPSDGFRSRDSSSNKVSFLRGLKRVSHPAGSVACAAVTAPACYAWKAQFRHRCLCKDGVHRCRSASAGWPRGLLQASKPSLLHHRALNPLPGVGLLHRVQVTQFCRSTGDQHFVAVWRCCPRTLRSCWAEALSCRLKAIHLSDKSLASELGARVFLQESLEK